MSVSEFKKDINELIKEPKKACPRFSKPGEFILSLCGKSDCIREKN